MTLIRTWFDFALQQMVAESYIHRFWKKNEKKNGDILS